jgi:Predicted permease.
VEVLIRRGAGADPSALAVERFRASDEVRPGGKIQVNVSLRNVGEAAFEGQLAYRINGSAVDTNWLIAGQGLVLGVFGGLLGVGLTLPLAEVLNRIAEALVGFDGLVQVPTAMLYIGFGIATVVGTISASVVAWRISRLDTLESLG